MDVKINIVNAFIDGKQGGNPAGVVLNADIYSDTQKQEIAKAAGLSETAFISESDTDAFKLDFFTPNMRIAHCGHATIASFSFLSDVGLVGEGQTSKETVDGSRRINMKGNMAFMEQLAPRYNDVTSRKEGILNSLNLSEDDVVDGPLLVNTGNSFIIIGVKDASTLATIQPDQKAIEDISNEFDLIGYYVYTQETILPERDASTRMFAPRFGIAEEAATGMAAGPLACYFFDKKDIAQTQFKFEQGAYMTPASPSIITVDLEIDQGCIKSLMAGGIAKMIKEIIVKI